MMVMIVTKMKHRCTYAHQKGTRGSGDIASFILSLNANRGEWSATSTGCFAPRAKVLFPINRRLGGPQTKSGCFGEEKNLFLICQIHSLVTNAFQVLDDEHLKNTKLMWIFCLGKCYSW